MLCLPAVRHRVRVAGEATCFLLTWSQRLLKLTILALTTCDKDEDEMYIRQWSEGFEGGGVEWGGVMMDED